MTTGLKWFIVLISAIFIAIGLLFYAVRFQDGPMEIISGGAFTSGEVAEQVDDWSFLASKQTVEMQTMIPPRSRTMWIVVADNRPFVVSAFMNTAIGKVWKKWPRTLEQDNRAILRVDGKLYQMSLNRVTTGEIIPKVIDRFNEKYNTEYTREVFDSGSSWLFELKPQ